MRRKFFGFVLSTATAAISVIHARPASACGGCFHADTDTSTSFVTDHRMAISISTKETILWDQVKYTGNPSEFAWVLPVSAGTRIEVARDEWLEALDQATRPAVKGPDVFCGLGSREGGSGGYGNYSGNGYRGSDFGGNDSSGGCSCAASLDDSAPSSAGSANADAGFSSSADAASMGKGSGFNDDPDVLVVGQAVVGPYASVVIRSSKGAAIYDWLRNNGFSVPANIAPILAAYTGEGFDFLALRLRPNVGVGAMQPVRVVMPGAVNTLPLRMVAAGIGAKVGITLFVVTEGRMRPSNFPEVTINPHDVRWDFQTQRSTYRELVDAALLADKRTWITEYAGRAFSSTARTNAKVPVDQLYHEACLGLGPVTVSCGPAIDVAEGDAGPVTSDAGLASDGSADASADADESAPDASVAPECTETKDACELFDDATSAIGSLHRSDLWVTRLRAELDAEDCSKNDLVLTAAGGQTEVSSQFKTDTFTDPNVNPCPSGMRPLSLEERSAAATRNGASSGDGTSCSTARGDAIPISPILGAVGVVLVFRSAQRRRRR